MNLSKKERYFSSDEGKNFLINFPRENLLMHNKVQIQTLQELKKSVVFQFLKSLEITSLFNTMRFE